METLLGWKEYLDDQINFSKFLAKMTTRGKILKKYLSHHLSKSKNEIQKNHKNNQNDATGHALYSLSCLIVK